MNGQKAHTKNLLGLEEMADIGAAVVATSIAGAAILQRTEVLGIGGIAHYQASGMSHGGAIAGYASRKYAVEHVHAQIYGFHNAVRGSHTH